MFISSKHFVAWINWNALVKYSPFQGLWDSADESDMLYKGYGYKDIVTPETDT